MAFALRYLLPIGCAAISLSSAVTAQEAQPTITAAPSPPDELDADSPLDEMPGIGVDWPDAGKPLEPLPALPAIDPGVIAETGLDQIPNLDENSNGTALAEGEQTQTDAEQVATIEGERRYELDLSGFDAVATRRFVESFDGLSVLRQGEGDPANAAQINRRMVEDQALLEAMLRNAGYYDSLVMTGMAPRASDNKIVVRFSAILGPRYTYNQVNLIGIDGYPGDEQERMRTLYGLRTGMPVIAESLVKAKTLLSTELLETGYPFVEVGQETVTIDHDTRFGQLDQPVSPGQRLRFGQIIALDNGLLGARHIQRIARFDPGEYYRQSEVEDLRNALIATGLVSTVTVKPQPSVDGTTTDIAVNLEPAPLRTLSAELGFDTGNGLRLEAGWQHRNLFPPEGALLLRGVIGTREQLLSATLRRNNWRRRDQVASVQFLLSNSNVPAFEARTIMLQARVERSSTLIYQKRWSWYGEAELIGTDEKSYSFTEGAIVNRRYAIGSLAGYVHYDRSNDLLDPTRGYRISLLVRPEVSFENNVFTYVRTQLDATTYWPAFGRTVLAGRVRLGAIAGASRDTIAPSRRLYAGGGSSVRGYGYQAVGPRAPEVDGKLGDPLGGTGLMEASVEARVPLFGAFSVVPFIDAGTLYDGPLPNGDAFDNIRIGAGVGVRYASNFGPIRIDVGTPVNPQPGDSRIGVYVSLGQAF